MKYIIIGIIATLLIPPFIIAVPTFFETRFDIIAFLEEVWDIFKNVFIVMLAVCSVFFGIFMICKGIELIYGV